jgi:hypothetical protein
MFNIFSRVAELEKQVAELNRHISVLNLKSDARLIERLTPKPYEKVMAKAEEIKRRGRKRKVKTDK